jgi:hypothetical protein
VVAGVRGVGEGGKEGGKEEVSRKGRREVKGGCSAVDCDSGQGRVCSARVSESLAPVRSNPVLRSSVRLRPCAPPHSDPLPLTACPPQFKPTTRPPSVEGCLDWAHACSHVSVAEALLPQPISGSILVREQHCRHYATIIIAFFARRVRVLIGMYNDTGTVRHIEIRERPKKT